MKGKHRSCDDGGGRVAPPFFRVNEPKKTDDHSTRAHCKNPMVIQYTVHMYFQNGKFVKEVVMESGAEVLM